MRPRSDRMTGSSASAAIRMPPITLMPATRPSRPSRNFVVYVMPSSHTTVNASAIRSDDGIKRKRRNKDAPDNTHARNKAVKAVEKLCRIRHAEQPHHRECVRDQIG